MASRKVEYLRHQNGERFYPVTSSKAVYHSGSTISHKLDSQDSRISQALQGVNSAQEQLQSIHAGESAGHFSAIVASEGGVHGLRFYNGKLQVRRSDGSWIATDSAVDNGLAPENMRYLSVGYSSIPSQLLITAIDPDDTVVDGRVLSRWGSTTLVRKEGSVPTDISDGIVVAQWTKRNQYSQTPFTDSGLSTGIDYYYRAFPVSVLGAVNGTGESVNSGHLLLQLPSYLGVDVDYTTNKVSKVANLHGVGILTNNRELVDFDGHVLSDYTPDALLAKGYQDDTVSYSAGTRLNVMVRIPRFYYRYTVDASDPITSSYQRANSLVKTASYYISEYKLPGFVEHPAFKGSPYILVSAFECGLVDSAGHEVDSVGKATRLCSAAGLTPATGAQGSLSLEQARVLAQANGSGWGLIDIHTWEALQLIALVQGQFLNAQGVIVSASTNQPAYGNVANDRVLPAGMLGSFTPDNSISTGSGMVHADDSPNATWQKVASSLCGIENLWGNTWTWIDGITIQGKTGDVTVDGKTRCERVVPRVNGYISRIVYNGTDTVESGIPIFMPGEVRGDSVSIPGDYYYQNIGSQSSQNRYLVAGGDYQSGPAAGLFCYDFTTTGVPGRTIGARMIYRPLAG